MKEEGPMTVIENAVARLPDHTQDAVVDWLVRTGLFRHVPAFKMLLRACEFAGANLQELNRTFAQARDAGPSLVDALRNLGGEIAFLAHMVEEGENAQMARDLYFRAALYYLMADGFTAEPGERIRNYVLAMPCFDRFRRLSRPAIQKLTFPYSIGTIAAHFRLPCGGAGPFPAVIILQGNDGVKEWMVAFENLALARGMATLTVDQPGWGESGLTGNTCASVQDLQTCVRIATDYLEARPEIRDEAVGMFGVSLGSLLAFCGAGLEPRIAAVAGLGGPFYVKEVWEKLPALQKRKAYRYTGLQNLEQLEAWFARLQIAATLAQVRCPALVVHGAKDELVPPRNAHALVAEMGGEPALRIIPGGDHLGTCSLPAQLYGEIFDWLAGHLRSRQPNAVAGRITSPVHPGEHRTVRAGSIF
jgi:pimeloyl-ACP methyl ester carboxylesterase